MTTPYLPQEGLQKIIARSWVDPDFRATLLADAVGTLKAEGIDVPPDMRVDILEDAADIVHLVLPNRPDGEMTEAEAARVTAGIAPLTPFFPFLFVVDLSVLFRKPQ